MSSTLLAQTLHIPAAQWDSVIKTFYDQLGTPTLVIPAGPLANADQVAWGTGAAELRCIKEYRTSLVPTGKEVFAGCPNELVTTLAFDSLKGVGFKVKEDLHTIHEYALVDGHVKQRTILLGSFYVPQTTKALKESDVVGVIHNPNYPDAMGFRVRCGTSGAAQVLSYCLAGIVGAAMATWLGRR